MSQSPPPAPADRERQIEAALQMPHLRDAKAQSDQALDRRPEAPGPSDDPKMAETYAFTLDRAGQGGRRWQGRFVNKIVSIKDKKLIGMMRARQAGGVPVESLTADVFNLIFMTCWLEVSLSERPDWFRDIDSLHDVSLIEAVFEEVTAHESTFWGLEKSSPASAPTG